MRDVFWLDRRYKLRIKLWERVGASQIALMTFELTMPDTNSWIDYYGMCLNMFTQLYNIDPEAYDSDGHPEDEIQGWSLQ